MPLVSGFKATGSKVCGCGHQPLWVALAAWLLRSVSWRSRLAPPHRPGRPDAAVLRFRHRRADRQRRRRIPLPGRPFTGGNGMTPVRRAWRRRTRPRCRREAPAPHPPIGSQSANRAVPRVAATVASESNFVEVQPVSPVADAAATVAAAKIGPGRGHAAGGRFRPGQRHRRVRADFTRWEPIRGRRSVSRCPGWCCRRPTGVGSEPGVVVAPAVTSTENRPSRARLSPATPRR